LNRGDNYANCILLKIPVAKTLVITALTAALLTCAADASAGSIGDFLKALGTSISHPEKQKSAPKPVNKHPKSKTISTQSADFPPSTTATATPEPSPTPTLPQVQIRPASTPSAKGLRRDLPYAIPVPNKPGFVTSPYAPKEGFVDVHGFPSGTEVKDPYSGKTFLTP
jgi:hypothetical protein